MLVSSFTCKLGDWASDYNSEIHEMKKLGELINYARVSFSIEDIERKNLYSLLRSGQSELSLHDYTQEFNSSYPWWQGSIAIKTIVYMYIGGQKMGLYAYI